MYNIRKVFVHLFKKFEVNILGYKKITTKKKYEEICEILHEKIMSGELKEGDRLDSVEHLAEQLNVSRSAVREALASLKAMGLIEIKQGSGTYVKQMPEQLDFQLSATFQANQQHVPHLLELRKIIEVGTVASAARNRTQQDIEKMQLLLNKMKNAQGDGEIGEQADFEFHRTIAIASQNPLLANLLDQVAGLTIEIMRETRKLSLFSKQTTLERLYEDHMQIFLAIKQQNPELAELAMYSHLSNVEKILTKYMEQTK